jgi:uncharacterized protein involved in outer membrane biogenesis
MTGSRILAVIVAATLVVAAVFVFVGALDVDQYRDELAEFVEARTGRSFSIDGEIGFTPALVPTISLERVRLGNPAWAQPGDLITIERVEAELALDALLHAQLKVRRLHLQGVELVLATHRDGRGSWVLETDTATLPSSAFPAPDYDLESVQLSRMTVRFLAHDSAPRQLDVHSLRLTPRDPEPALDIELGATFNGFELQAHGSMSRLKQLVDDTPSMLSLEGRLGELQFALTGRTAKPSRAAVDTLEFSLTAAGLKALAAPFALELAGAKPVALSTSLVREDKRYRLEPLLIRVGTSELRAELVIEPATPRWRIDGDIVAPHLDAADFLTAGERASDAERVFPETALPFGLLSRVDADVAFASDTLITPVAVFDNLTSRFELADGKAVIGPVKARVAEGEFLARFDIRTDPEMPEVVSELSLSGVQLDHVAKIAARKTVTGGALDVAVNITGSGHSAREIMTHANGTIAVDIGAARFNNKAVNLAEADLLWSFVTRLNPFAAREPSSEIECVAVRFPIRNGIADNPVGIGMLTRSLSILGGGKLNFATERIDLRARPKPREGLGLSVAGLVDFLRIGGTLKKPQAVTDTVGVATAGVKVGAAVATAGLSLVAEGLFDRAGADASVCEVVRGSLGPRAAQRDRGSVIDATASKAKAAARGAGEALKNVFEGLFGN